MRVLIGQSWPLFLGLALIMIGNGLQGTLLGLRASIEGYGTVTTGVIMSLYYTGYMAGSIVAPRLLRNVGHIRVFAALGSVAAASALLYGVFINPAVWGAIRIVAGFCYAGLYVVIESWLNDMAPNNQRGKFLGLYMLVCYGGLALGQMMLTVADPSDIDLFILVSVLVSLSIPPLALIRRPMPDFSAPVPMKLRDLYHSSPLGMASILTAGVLNGVVYGMAAVYGSKAGLDVSSIAALVAAVTLGGISFQLPVGWLSDRMDRRYIIIMAAFATALFALLTGFSLNHLSFMVISAFIFGGLMIPLYSLGVAHICDQMDSSRFIGASSASILVNGIGSCFGPVMVAIMMSLMGPAAFFPFVAIILMALGVFGIYRVSLFGPISPIKRKTSVMLPFATSTMLARLFRQNRSDST